MKYNTVIQNNDVISTPDRDYRRTRRRTQEALRLGILDAAGRLLTEEGPSALSMRRIAQDVNASTQVLYTMFGSKDGLANALLREGFVRLAEAQEKTAENDDPLHLLSELTATYLENAIANPNYYRVMFMAAIPNFRPSEPTLTENWKTFAVFEGAVGACAAAGLFAREVGEAPREAALSLWSAAHGVVSLYLAGILPDEAEARRVHQRTIDGLIDSLRITGDDGQQDELKGTRHAP